MIKKKTLRTIVARIGMASALMEGKRGTMNCIVIEDSSGPMTRPTEIAAL
jgi:hypothetical protein